MLIEFTAENFRSLRDPVTFSMIATSLDAKDPRLGTDNVVKVSKNLTLLRSAVIYGANASGKSNLIKAFRFFTNFIRNSARESVADDPIPVEPFLLREDTRVQPSMFEVVFLIDGVQYRYGFRVTKERVLSEWLYYTPSSREAVLFTRDEEEGISSSRFKEGRGLEERTRHNALFLSVVAQFNGELATRIQQWFIAYCRVINTTNDRLDLSDTRKYIGQGDYYDVMVKFLNELNLGIEGISFKDIPHSIPMERLFPKNELRRLMFSEIHTRHTIRDTKGIAVREEDFPIAEMESEGTKKVIALLGPLFDALTHGKVLFIDEIDARLHPLLTQPIIRLFHSAETNPKNAQLICATHDTNLLDAKLFRRDQIFFTEKVEDATSLYSLAEFKLDGEKRVRSDASYERDYIQGRYGAIPYIGDLHHLFSVEVPEAQKETENVPEVVLAK